MKITISRNKREGRYAGYYPYRWPYNYYGHKRWDAWAMAEFYPRIQSVYWEGWNKDVAPDNAMSYK